MKKLRVLMFLPLIIGALAGCEQTIDPVAITSAEGQQLKMSGNEIILDFYALNDLHGSVYEAVSSNPTNTEIGMSKIGAFIRAKREENLGGSFFISNGDAYQGTADSNITGGKIIMDMFNLLDFETNTVGNHEFDWTITKLLESQAEVGVDFPLLAANIIDLVETEKSGKKTYVTWAEPTKVITRGVGDNQVKVGIVGSIAYGLERTILSSAVRGYQFEQPKDIVIEHAERLRNEENCDVVIYTTHGDAGSSGKDGLVDPEIANYVDVIFTGHAHREWNTPMINSSNIKVPVLQGMSNGKRVSYVQLGVDKNSRGITVKNGNGAGQVLGATEVATYGTDPSIDAIIKKWDDKEIAKVKNKKLGSVSQEISKNRLSDFLSEEMLKYAQTQESEVIAAMHNGSGGVRDILRKGNITYGDVYKVFPFDNVMYFVSLYGWEVRSMLKSYSNSTSIASSALEDYTVYRVMLISFIAEDEDIALDGSDSSKVKPGTEIIMRDKFPRDIVADAFTNHKNNKPLG